MNLLCIKDEKQLAVLSESDELNNRQNIILPLMPKAALGLLSLGMLNVRLPIEFLSREERQAIFRQAIDLSKSWYRSLDNKVEYQGIDLLECCRLQMMGFFQDVLAAEMIAPRLMAEYQTKKALFLKKPSTPSFGHSMHNGTADIFEAILQWRFRKAGIEVEIRAEEIVDKEHVNKPQANLRVKIKRKLGTYQQYFTSSKLKSKNSGTLNGPADPRRIGLSDLPKDKPLLIGLGDGYDLLVIWPYLKTLADQIDGFPVLLNGAPNFEPTTLRSGLIMDDKFRYLYTGDIPLSDHERIDLETVRNACLTALENGNLLPPILQNPLLSFQFKFLWDSLVPHALNAARQAASFFAQYNAVLYLDDYCAGPANRAWTEAGNLAGVPTATVQHGAVNLVELYDFHAQWALAWGELVRENWTLASPEKHDSIIVSGDPSMEVHCAVPATVSEIKRNAVLLLTGGFLHQVWTDMDLQGLILTWEEIARIAQERPSFEFIIKPHPSVRDLGDWYREFVQKKLLANMRVIDNKKLEDLLPSAFLAVLVGKPGTAGLVTALAGVPFVYLDTMLCREVVGYKIWCDKNGVLRLTSTAKLAEVLDQLYVSQEKRNTLLTQNRRFSRLYLHPYQPLEICKQLGLRI
jgi:hypothetical protein